LITRNFPQSRITEANCFKARARGEGRKERATFSRRKR
jgi:hypothetical protein